MGNAPSIAELPPEWEDILPNITSEDIINSSRRKCRVVDQSVYLDDDLFDLDDDNHVPIALAILRAHPHLKDIRFKLVPGKMTEENYWAALFGILHDGGIDIEDVVGAIEDDYETGDEVDESTEIGENQVFLPPVAQSPTGQPGKEGNGKKLGRSPIAKLERDYFDDDNDALESTADATNTPPSYLEEIQAQQAHVARLQKALRVANHKTRKLALELHKERKHRHDEGINDGGDDVVKKDDTDAVASCPKCTSTSAPKRRHKATWKPHSDCKEFLNLDDHLKENLRKEKEKRLNEVLSQMKFILDTDDIKDSYGSWPCCGKEEYDTPGCA